MSITGETRKNEIKPKNGKLGAVKGGGRGRSPKTHCHAMRWLREEGGVGGGGNGRASSYVAVFRPSRVKMEK